MMRVTLFSIAAAAATLLVFQTVRLTRAEGKNPESHTGCLAKGEQAGTFMLTHVDGGSEEYELVGGEGDLGAHAGHKVEVKGNFVSADQVARFTGQKAEGDGAQKYFRVRSMSHVAATCP